MNKVFCFSNQVNRISSLTVAILLYAASLFGQKPAIDTSNLDTWPTINTWGISNDGTYTYYLVADRTNSQTLRIVSNIDKSTNQFSGPEVTDIDFSFDSRYLIFKKSKDSLGIFNLKSNRLEYIPNVKSLKISENSNYLAYNTGDSLIVRNLSDNKRWILAKTIAFDISPSGQSLIFLHKSENEKQRLGIINFSNGDTKTFIESEKINHFNFDKTGKSIAVLASRENGEKVIGIYNLHENHLILLPEKSLTGLSYQFTISPQDLIFSKKDDKLLVRLINNNQSLGSKLTGYPGVKIWNSEDMFLLSEREPKGWYNYTRRQYYGIIDIQKKSIIRVNLDNKEIVSEFLKQGGFEEKIFNFGRRLWDSYERGKSYETPALYSISASDGSKQMISKGANVIEYHASPDKKFLIWFDPDSLNYYSYEIDKNIIRNISHSVPVPLYDIDLVKSGRLYMGANFQVDAWDTTSSSVFLYDKNDIWEINLLNDKAPRNITSGYGAKNNLSFSFIKPNADVEYNINQNNPILLTAFDRESKNNGFWTLLDNNKKGLEKLAMEPYSYYTPRTGSIGFIEKAEGYEPIKAKNAMVFLVRRSTASEFPNLYLTRNFKVFKPISDLHPEKKYNWLTAELIKWKIPDGTISQGILYKPENFNPAKKYPLIFDYYEKRSDALNKYIEPDWSDDRINIPYYVSNGYLIFVPDIYYPRGHNGLGAVNSVVSAAQYLKKLPYVDSTKLGLQGHSFGGLETNYLVTHTKNLFAAACEASGVSDFISSYDQLPNGEVSDRHGLYEEGIQGSGMGVGNTPWSNLQLYAENSPVLSIAQVTTPLLMMHGDNDGAVPYPQAMEMFLALRRAGKKAWLLEYPNEDHSLAGDDAKDYTKRMKEFFDYYLKNAPRPEWMNSIGITY